MQNASPIEDIWTCRRPGCDPESTCASCGRQNYPGHEKQRHVGFVYAVDPTGEIRICDLCAMVLANSAFVVLHLDIPAAEALA